MIQQELSVGSLRRLVGFTSFFFSEKFAGGGGMGNRRWKNADVVEALMTGPGDLALLKGAWQEVVPPSCGLDHAIRQLRWAIISGNHMTPPHVTLFTVRDLYPREHVWCSPA